MWEASDKIEYSTDFPEVPHNPVQIDSKPIDWDAAMATLEINRSILPVDWMKPGYTAAVENLNNFLTHRLKDFEEKRNDPNIHCSSNLSPYLHFGQVSAQRCALEANKATRATPRLAGSRDSFLEELIVRRELADNFCYCKYQLNG